MVNMLYSDSKNGKKAKKHTQTVASHSVSFVGYVHNLFTKFVKCSIIHSHKAIAFNSSKDGAEDEKSLVERKRCISDIPEILL